MEDLAAVEVSYDLVDDQEEVLVVAGVPQALTGDRTSQRLVLEWSTMVEVGRGSVSELDLAMKAQRPRPLQVESTPRPKTMWPG